MSIIPSPPPPPLLFCSQTREYKQTGNGLFPDGKFSPAWYMEGGGCTARPPPFTLSTSKVVVYASMADIYTLHVLLQYFSSTFFSLSVVFIAICFQGLTYAFFLIQLNQYSMITVKNRNYTFFRTCTVHTVHSRQRLKYKKSTYIIIPEFSKYILPIMHFSLTFLNLPNLY